MTAKESNFTVRMICEEVLAWQALQGCQRIPNRRSHDVHEKTLAKRFEDVLRRRYCDIGDKPCQQLLSADEIHFINGIPGVTGAGAHAAPGASTARKIGEKVLKWQAS